MTQPPASVDVDVVIAVLTYRRPDDLTSLLPHLAAHAAGSAVRASILVVDNDAVPSARSVVEESATVRYVHEPQPGIVAARNRALDEARDARLLIFIDDDERPEPGWLDALVNAWATRRPAAVAGPVLSKFSRPLDPWIEAGGFFRRLRHPTGTVVPSAATNNLLLDLDVVRAAKIRFDARFDITGGSDVMFTRALVAAGGRIEWCDEAIAIDLVRPERQNRAWVLARAQRVGNSESRTLLFMQRPGLPRLMMRVRLVARGAIRVGGGLTRSCYGAARANLVHHARGRRTAARGRGMIAGAIGGVVVGYDRPDAQRGPGTSK